MIDADVNAKNWSTKADVMIDFIWNPSICECECDKSCDVGEYLDYEICKCRKRLIDKLIEESSEDINGNEMIYHLNLYNYENICKSCTLYIVSLIITFIIIIDIGSICICFYWHTLKNWCN